MEKRKKLILISGLQKAIDAVFVPKHKSRMYIKK